MLKDENIICISSIDWDFIWQGHQEIMTAFARNGNRVLFIENTGVRTPGIKDMPRIKKRVKNWFRGVKGIREEMKNLYIFSPIVLPFPYSRTARYINRHLVLPLLERWMKAIDFSDPILWIFLPTPLSLDIVDSLTKKLVIYYCIDNFSVSSLSAKRIKRSEIKLLRRADLVFVTSKELYNSCSEYNDKTYLFPFGVNFEEFENIRLNYDSIMQEFQDKKRPIIGYVGGIHKWIDLQLVKYLAEKNKDYSFVFVGPIQVDVSPLSNLENVHFLGNQDHKQLPFFIKNFDVCIIPYLISDYTKNVYPTKLNEYLAMDKPVVSTPLPEIITFNKRYDDIICIGRDKEEFARYIKGAFNKIDERSENQRINAARENSWEVRIEEMSNLAKREIEKKKLDKKASWKADFLFFYKKARKKTVKLGIACLLLYLLLFKTSFVWFLASPLRISDPLQKVDAIVVFGGGVGETGSPGKSTIERARHAAKLYKKGYADKIIFSSGYTYVYNDAENMKLIAVSMGVPGEDIILEQKANSAYENVIFSKEILHKNRWNSILLISATYNMRRVFLVFNKWGDDIKVFYIPVEKNQFYDQANGVDLQQIRAIMHEYLGILYYWIKGYV